MDDRARVLGLFQQAVDRPVRWASEHTSLGDFEGRGATLELFDVPAYEQRALMKELRDVRRRASSTLGQPLRLVFHTPTATTRYYADVRASGCIVELPPPRVAPAADRRPREVEDVSPLTAVRFPLRTVCEDAA